MIKIYTILEHYSVVLDCEKNKQLFAGTQKECEQFLNGVIPVRDSIVVNGKEIKKFR